MGSDDEKINQIVDLAMPKGVEFDLPDDWAQDLRSRGQRKESPSSIRTFMSCPLRWYLERYSNLEGSPSGWPAVVGSFVHRVLEVFYTEPAEERDQDLLDRVFRESWNSIKEDDGTGIIDQNLQADFNRLRDEAENMGYFYGGFYKRAKKCVDAIVDFDGEDLSKVDVVDTEQWVRMKSNGVLIRGKIDRTINHPVSGVIIQDYKTGKVPSVEEDQGLKDHDGNLILDEHGNPIMLMSDSFMAMGFYALMTAKGSSPNGDDAKLVSAVQLLYVAQNVKYNFNIRPFTLKLVQALVDRITSEMNNVVKTGRITACTSGRSDVGQCAWCPASGICPMFDDTNDLTKMREELGI